MALLSENWSTLQRAVFVAHVSVSTDERDTARRAVERAADALEAEVCALIRRGAVVAAIGFPANHVPTPELVDAASQPVGQRELGELGEVWTMSAALDDRSTLLVARMGEDGFTREESDLLRGMARSLELTLRMVRTLDHERKLRRQSQHEIRERKRIERELAHQELHDSLTGLPNRTLLLDRTIQALERARGTSKLVAAMLIDLDHFKVTNDTLGHRRGDELLAMLARRLEGAVHPGSGPSRHTLARVAGDEFMVICERLSSEQDAITVAHRLQSALQAPFRIGEQDVSVAVSIGVAVAAAGSDDARDLGTRAEDLLRDADVAMSRAKERGRGCCEVFDEQMRVLLTERIQLESELRAGLERGELRLVYQPVVSVLDGVVVALEALVRWEHPTRGLLVPGQFIPIAEQSDLIVGIGEWVIEEACRQLSEWSRHGHASANVRISVNVSARQLTFELVALVDEALERHGLDPGRLALEITETLLIEQAKSSGAVLDSLKRLGVGLVLDDFGTGYSSLSYLKRFPIDQLKLDRTFVSELADDPRSAKIVSAAIEMARALGMTVVAEGVERLEQLEVLARLRCDYAQGFHFARPEPADAVARRLAPPPARRLGRHTPAAGAPATHQAPMPDSAPRDEDAERRATIGRTAGLLFLTGVPLGPLVELTVPGGELQVGVGLSLLGLISGLICLRLPWQQLSMRWIHATALVATLEVALAVATAGATAAVFSWLYVLVAAAAAYAFRPRRTLVAYVLILAAAIASPIVYRGNAGGDTLAGAVLGIVVIATMVAVVAALRERLEIGQQELRELASRDPLTGVGNYRLLHERLEYELLRHQRNSAKFSLLVIDLDRFKHVNERLGHAAGDDVLRRVARVLCAAVRQQDTVVRQGGDEFAVLAPETDAEGAEHLARRVKEQLGEVQFGGEPVGAAIGFAVYPDEANSMQLLLARADSRLLAEKVASREGDPALAAYAAA
jgi:diguanylate cyclase (GGDEF)-like protein